MKESKKKGRSGKAMQNKLLFRDSVLTTGEDL